MRADATVPSEARARAAGQQAAPENASNGRNVTRFRRNERVRRREMARRWRHMVGGRMNDECYVARRHADAQRRQVPRDDAWWCCGA